MDVEVKETIKKTIKDTIERLKALALDGGSHENLSAICTTLYQPQWGWNRGACSTLRDVLVGWLEQFDPDDWSDQYLDEVGLMRLPVDADGVPIRIGDELCGYGRPDGGIYCMATNGAMVYVGEVNDDAPKQWMAWCADQCRHYRKPTVEDVLHECCNEYLDAMLMDDTCDIPCGVPSPSEVIDKYAEKLREVMADE